MASITLTAPGSGQVWYKGQTKTISWSTTDISFSASITVELRKSGSLDSTITTSATNWFGYGTINWTIPMSLDSSNYYTIRVYPTGSPGTYDDSSNISIPGPSQSLTESITLADSVSVAERTYRPSHTENEVITLSDSPSVVERQFHQKPTQPETTTLADSFTVAERVFKPEPDIDETITLADSFTAAERLFKTTQTQADTVTLADSYSAVERVWDKTETQADAIALADTYSAVVRTWKHLVNISDTISLADAEPYFLELSESLNITDSYVVTQFGQALMYLMDSNSGSESFGFNRRSGWLPLGPLSTNPIVRDVNIKYKSSDAINIKLYADEDTSTAIFDQNFASSSSFTEKNLRVGRRAKMLMMEVTGSSSTNYDTEIERLEVGVDG